MQRQRNEKRNNSAMDNFLKKIGSIGNMQNTIDNKHFDSDINVGAWCFFSTKINKKGALI